MTSKYLSGRALGLLVIALVLIGAMVALGWWQYDAYDQHQRENAAEAAAKPAAPLDDLLGPDDAMTGGAVGRRVIARGEYAAAEQFYVEGLDGSPAAYAVVTPLVTGTGSAILVVRGAVDQPSDAPPPAGQVTVEGSVQPSTSEGGTPDDDAVTTGIRTSSLVSVLAEDLYSGYVIAERSQPADALPLVEPPTGEADRWAGIRNLIYAIQWWLFAAFVAFMWWRIVTDTAEGGPATDEGRSEPTEGDPDPADRQPRPADGSSDADVR